MEQLLVFEIAAESTIAVAGLVVAGALFAIVARLRKATAAQRVVMFAAVLEDGGLVARALGLTVAFLAAMSIERLLSISSSWFLLRGLEAAAKVATAVTSAVAAWGIVDVSTRLTATLSSWKDS